MNESLRPACAAAEAAPMRKLWPEVFSPACDKASRMDVTRCARDNGVPSWSTNSGPGFDGRTDRYPRTAATGHKVSPVLPRKR